MKLQENKQAVILELKKLKNGNWFIETNEAGEALFYFYSEDEQANVQHGFKVYSANDLNLAYGAEDLAKIVNRQILLSQTTKGRLVLQRLVGG